MKAFFSTCLKLCELQRFQSLKFYAFLLKSIKKNNFSFNQKAHFLLKISKLFKPNEQMSLLFKVFDCRE